LSVANSETTDSISTRQIQQLTPGGFYLKPGLRNTSYAYDYSVIGLFVCTVVLSVTDLVTTSIALRSGLKEGNIMLLTAESILKLNFFETIAATKLAFISGTAVLACVGMRSEIPMTRRIVFSSLAVFVLILLFVSVNNLVMINF
jgi:hypothetical protein